LGCDRMEKRDKIGVIVWLCVMLAATIGIEIRERWTWRLFGELRQEDVISIDVVYGVPPSHQFLPPYQMSQQDQIKVINGLQQLEVSIDLSDNPFAVINGSVKDGCMLWYFVMHLQDGSHSSFQIVPYGNITLNGREYQSSNVDLELQIYEIGESYVERILTANQTAS